MPKYIVGDKKYNIPQEEVEGFLAAFPDAKEFTEDALKDQAGKTQPQTPGATAEVTTAPDTESKSDIGFWESLGAKSLRGFSSTTRGLIEAAGGATMLLAGLGKNIATGEGLTDEEKQGLSSLIKFGSAPGMMGTQTFKNTEAQLSKSVRDLGYEGPSDALTKGDWAAAAELTVGGAIESLPSTLLAMTPGGLAVMGASAGGNKFSEEYEANPEESLLKLGVNATAAGIIEAQFERVTRNLGKQMGFVPADNAKQAIKVISNTLGKSFIKETGLAIVKEGLSEGATEATLIINDALTLGKVDDLATNLKRIGDATLIGGFTGGSFSTVAAVGGKNTKARQRAEQLLMPIAGKKEQKRIADEINGLVEALAKEETEAGAKKITEKIDNLQQEAARLKRQNSLTLSFLSDNDLKKYAENADKINEAAEIINSDKSSETAKELALEDLNKLNEENSNLLQSAVKNKFQDILQKSKAEAQESGIAFGVYNTEGYANRVEEIKKANPGIKINENAEGTIVQLPDGSQEILINEDVALENGAINVAAHELLHGILFNTVRNNPDAALNLGNALLEAVAKMDPKGIANTKLGNIVEKYKEAGVTEAEAAEEIITNLSDLIVTGNLEFNENIFVKIGDAIRRTLQIISPERFGKIKFDTGQDVYNFIKDYNRSIERGKFNKAMRAAKKGVTGKLVPQTKATEAEAQAASKSSLSPDDRQKMMDTYNAAMQNVERTEYSKNNPLPARLENELAYKFYGYVNTLVNKKFRQVEEEAIEKDDAVMILMGEVVNAMRTFNPAKNDDIAGYVASIVARRQSMIFADVKEEFTDDVETSKAAQAVVEEETLPTTEAQKFEEVKKKTILSEGIDTSMEIDGKTYESHVKDALTRSVARAVKKIDEEISQNRTVTPFVQAIKSDIAEELRQITKRFINQYGYEQFLIDHRELILSNFTTTYLSKHPVFRKGIEKSIGGKMGTDNQGNPQFQPNWTLPTETKKGKFEWVDANGKKAKIDRDNAGVRGLTSGPELIRRSTKIDKIVTENEFVDYHFQDGALRKKKKQNPEDGLAMQIASEIAFDYLKDDFLNEKTIFDKVKEYGEALGVIVTDAHAQSIARDIDRGTVKYSLGKADFTWLMNTTYEYADQQAIETLAKEKYANDSIKQRDMLRAIQDTPEYIYTVIKQLHHLKRGEEYERKLKDLMDGAGINNISIEVAGGNNNTVTDVFINLPNGEKISIEAKYTVDAQMGSFTLRKILDEGYDTTLKREIPAEIVKILDELTDGYNDLVEGYNKAARKVSAELGDPVIEPFSKPNNRPIVRISERAFLKLQNEGEQAKLDRTIKVPKESKIIEFLYTRKDVDYMQIGNGKGLYFIGTDETRNTLNAPTLQESLTGELDLNIRIQKKKKSDGSVLLPITVIPKINETATTEILKPSHVNLDDATKLKETLLGISKASITTDDKSRINSMISETGGITKADISEATATRMAKNKGMFRFYIPPSADDFVGLMYYMLRKGTIGNEDMQFIKEKLLDPFSRNNAAWESYKLRKLNDFRTFKKLIRKSPTAKLTAKNNAGFTNEDAVRVWLWNKKGTDLGDTITSAEKANLIEIVESNPDLLQFAQSMANLFGGAQNYPDPSGNWFNGSMTIDVIENINEFGRKTFFKEFNENVEEMFGKLNSQGEISGSIANKLRAAYGNNYVEALSDIIYRMKNGRSREFGKNRLMNQFNNWISNSVGAVMFFNTRSAILQQVSMINFINLSDNNPIKFAQAIANPKQYWSDWLELINSDFLVSRRQGIKIDVNQDEIAKAAESGKNPVQSVISMILKKGFMLTTWGDSNAIAMGGAAFYRNRINTYLKEGLTEEEAKKKAFEEFKEIAEESQQSSRPDRISQQQASTLGRVILAWANTPMQYARLTKKATLDLINGRGDWKTNMSKIVYYGAVQNLMFTYMQQGLFAMAFDGEDKEEEDAKKWEFTFNSMADGFLRGLGYGGAIASVLKNMVIEAIEQSKGRGNYDEVVWEALKLSPPLGSKIAKARAVGRTFGWKQEREKVFTEGISLDNPAFEAVGKGVSALTNIPLDRVVRKLDNISYPTRHEVEFWQAAALYLGWGQWELGLKDVQKKEKDRKSRFKKYKLKKK